MSTTRADPKPDFAAATATLRDTVKWLAAVFAALAAAVVGTGPMSGLGGMPDGADRHLAIGLLLVGFVCICAALWTTLRILRPEAMYRSYLIAPATPALLKGSAEKERIRLRQSIDDHGKDILPHSHQTLDALAKDLSRIDEGIKTAKTLDDPAAREREVARGQSQRDKYLAEAGRLLPLATYLRLQQRLQRALLPLFGLGVAALLSLAAFGIVVHRSDQDKAGPPINVNNYLNCPCGPPVPTQLPTLTPVLFDSDKASVSRDGIAAIERAREELIGRPGTVLLIRAYTDTVASDGYNAALARRRAEVVKGLLQRQGGVASQRLYVATLPERSLPQVTVDNTASQDNRSVWLQLSLLAPQPASEQTGK